MDDELEWRMGRIEAWRKGQLDMDDRQGVGNTEVYGTELLGAPGVREYVRYSRMSDELLPGVKRDRPILEYLGADDEWHDAEGSPLSMTDVIKARDRSMAERDGRQTSQSELDDELVGDGSRTQDSREEWLRKNAAITSRMTSEPKLSIEDARKVARLVRRMIPEQPYRALLDAGAQAMLTREWPHIDWELRNGEIIPFERRYAHTDDQ